MASVIGFNLLLVLVILFLLWILSVVIKDASIVDPFWGTGFVVVAIATWLAKDSHHWRDHLITAMVLLWAFVCRPTSCGATSAREKIAATKRCDPASARVSGGSVFSPSSFFRAFCFG